jgi:RNA polymerase sigma factor (sigma-70 family)
MSAAELPSLIRYLRRAAEPDGTAAASDASLLKRYAESGDDSAFELLVWRHAQAVLGVCRRILRDEHAAHDCFQATFLTLARTARSIARRESVGGWLYKVAYRIATKARRRSARRALREQPLAEYEPPSREAAPADVAALQELGAALDEEINRLGGYYRDVLVLRCLAGKSTTEAAAELGCPTGTVESRLARARERLATALARRGFLVPAALLVGHWPGTVAEAGVPLSLVTSVVKAAKLVAIGEVALGGAISTAAVVLSEGALHTMSMTKTTSTLALVLVLGIGTTAAGLSARPAAPPQSAGAPAVQHEPAAPKKGKQVESSLVLERLALLSRDTLTSYIAQRDLFTEINDLTSKPRERGRALARAREALKRAREDHRRLSAKRDELEKEIVGAKLPPGKRKLFDPIDLRLKRIHDGAKDLEKHVAVLEKVDREEARDFIFRIWPTLNTAGLVEQISRAERHFKTCKDVGDTIGPSELLKVNEKLCLRLKQEVTELKPEVNIDDEKPARQIAELLRRLRKLDKDIHAYLGRKSGD